MARAGAGCGQGRAVVWLGRGWGVAMAGRGVALPALCAQGVFLSQLLGEFSWLTEETLLRRFDVGFSGQLRCLVQHALSLLRAQVAVLRIHRGDLLVIARPGPGLMHLAHLSAELLPAFLSEAVGGESPLGLRLACRVREAPAYCLMPGPFPSLCGARAAGRQSAT